jgi:hypothetical protein
VYLHALRKAGGGFERSDWVKSWAVMAAFAALGVVLPNVALADKDSPYAFTKKQMGTFDVEEPDELEESTPAGA